MVFWRISRHRDLNGAGGLKASGRWHFTGQPVVYLSDSPASALLEVCIHTASNDVPPSFTLLRVEGPDIAVPGISITDLPQHWQLQPAATREIGTRWLQAAEGVLLAVPSAIVPRTTNFLLNPLHPEAKEFRICETQRYPFDPRLKT